MQSFLSSQRPNIPFSVQGESSLLGAGRSIVLHAKIKQHNLNLFLEVDFDVVELRESAEAEENGESVVGQVAQRVPGQVYVPQQVQLFQVLQLSQVYDLRSAHHPDHV